MCLRVCLRMCLRVVHAHVCACGACACVRVVHAHVCARGVCACVCAWCLRGYTYIHVVKSINGFGVDVEETTNTNRCTIASLHDEVIAFAYPSNECGICVYEGIIRNSHTHVLDKR